MDSRIKDELFRANEMSLELMIEAARADARPPFELAGALASQLLELTPAARLRIAQRPYALLTFRLSDAAWWRSVAGGKAERIDAWLSSVSREKTTALARRLLTLAWNVTACRSLKSSVSLGISPTVTEILSRLTLEQTEQVAAMHTLALGPRWNLGVWERLLEAATDDEPLALDLFDRWAAQFLPREMMRQR